jgi:hypothetical protein
LIFVVRLQFPNGGRSGLRTTSSLVWRHSAGKGWRIVWDHTSSEKLDDKTLAALMDALPGRLDSEMRKGMRR